MDNVLLRAVGYRRVSMREQVDGFSLDAQENNIRKYAEDHGWEIIGVYTDAGISAKRDSERPQLIQLMEDAEARKFDVVIVDKIDRFYRHLGGLLNALDRLKEDNVFFVSVQERLDFTTPWGKLTLTVLGMLAEIYIDNLRQETTKGKVQRARDGYWNGNVPYGYCKGLCSDCKDVNGAGYCPEFGSANKGNGRTLILHPVDQHAVMLIFELFLTGKYSSVRVAELVNKSSFTLADGTEIHYRQRGKPGKSITHDLNKDFVRSLLNNIFYTGQVPYYSNKRRVLKAVYPGKHQAIISQETFQRIKEVRILFDKNARVKKGSVVRLYPLTGILHCASCGWQMRGSSIRKRFFYLDSSRIDRRGLCNQHMVDAEQIENELVSYLLVWIENWRKTDKPDVVVNLISELEEHIKQITNLYLLREITLEDYEKTRNRETAQLQTLRETGLDVILPLTDSLKEKLSDWRSTLPIEKKKTASSHDRNCLVAR
ncbi:MAG: recombinase family protein [Chloroflexi bacterium]|nr:recombinase family protein [Chloroflexota bacterium]